MPLEPATIGSPYRVTLIKTLDSDLLKLVRDVVQTFVISHDGRLPDGAEWNSLIEFNSMIDPDQGLLRQVNDSLRTRLFRKVQAQAMGGPITDEMVAAVKTIIWIGCSTNRRSPLSS